MPDAIEKIGHSFIQHGSNSDRVYLMKLDPADLPGLHAAIMRRVEEHAYGKVFAKIPANAASSFLERGYREEARIKRFYRGTTDAVFMCLYRNAERAIDSNREMTQKVIETALATNPGAPVAPPAPGFTVRALTPDDIPMLASLYNRIFPSYPFPITDQKYLAQTMASHVAYFGVLDGTMLVAASSAEIDTDALAVEMTDFATAPEYRGKGLARRLLAMMDTEMRGRGMLTAYTIARAVSHGMNITFARGSYTFGGTLVNNTGISGSIESMNVWFRHF